MDENIVITKEELKFKIESEIMEVKQEILNFENNTNAEILEILKERENMLEKRLNDFSEDFENFKKCQKCGEKIEDKRFFIDCASEHCKNCLEI